MILSILCSLKIGFSTLERVRFGGLEREFIIEAPAKLSSRPGLIFVFHGFGDSPESIREYSGFGREFQKHDFVVIYPRGYRNKEGKANFQVGYEFQDKSVDDVGFMRELISIAEKRFGINRANVFSTGMSNGGDMSFFLARQNPPIVRAIAPIAGTMMSCWKPSLKSAHPVSVFAVHGTKDDVTRWEGDLNNRDGWGAYWGVEQVIEWWVKSLKLSPSSNLTGTAKDGVVRQEWRSKSGEVEFKFFKVIGGGHSWPDSVTSAKLSLAYEIYQFFESHRAR
jgi:polyhydroxybutyrate depolymerase